MHMAWAYHPRQNKLEIHHLELLDIPEILIQEHSCQLCCLIIQTVLSEEYVTQLSQSNENASLTSLHTSCVCCIVEPLLIFGCQVMTPQSVLNLYQHILLKRVKTYQLHHFFHLLLICSSQSTTAPLSGH